MDPDNHTRFSARSVRSLAELGTGFPLPDRAIATLLDRLTSQLTPGVVSLVLFGGLTRGEWAEATSDIDLVCLLEREVNCQVRAALDAVYDGLEAQDPGALHPLYVYYMPVESLRHPQFRIAGGPAGLRVGNGKRREFTGFPMSVYDSYDIRNFGRTLYGQELRQAFPEVTVNELRAMTRHELKDAAVRYTEIGLPLNADVQMNSTNTWNYVAWLCRSLYSARHPGMILAKGQAMTWAKAEIPIWTALIDVALAYRFTPKSVTPEQVGTLRLGFGVFFAQLSARIEEALGG